MVIHWALAMLCWLLGVALQSQQAQVGEGRWGWMVAGLGVLLWQMLSRLGRRGGPRRRQLIPLGWCLMAGCLGWGQTQWRAAQGVQAIWPDALADQTILLTARIDAMPQPRLWGTGLEVQVQEVSWQGRRWRAGQAWALPGLATRAACPDRVSLSWTPDPGQKLLPGQTWRWQVQLHAVRGQSNPGGFDSELWMFERGLRAQGKVLARGGDASQPLAILLSEAQGRKGLIDRWRTQLRDRVLAHVSDARVAGLVIGLTVGDQSAIHDDDWQVLRASGTAHLASISGLHITMMGWIISALVARLWRRSARLMHWLPAPTASRWAGVLGAWFYALMAGWGIPAQRTVLMLAMVALLHSGGRRWPWPLVLLAAAVGVTVLDPWALTQAGFWLSFAAVGLLMLAGGESVLLPDMPWSVKLRLAMTGVWRTQATASIGLAPLSLVFFQTVSLVGLLANLVCIPLFSFVITPLAMMGYVWPHLWDALTPVVQGTMAALRWMAESSWAVAQGPGVTFWAAALGLIVGAWMLAPVPWRWRARVWPALLPLLWPTAMSQIQPSPPHGEVQITVVDIGQGTAVLVRTASHALLYDTGPRLSSENDAGRRILVGLLRAVNVRQLDELLISHGDSDHVGGAVSVLRAVPAVQLRTSLAADHELRQWSSRSGKHLHHVGCEAGQRWSWDGVVFDILHPSGAELSERDDLGDNALSCVLRVEAHGRRILLTGDIEAEQEAALLARDPQALAAEVLVVPHHGSKTSSTDAFLAAVTPQIAVIQAGARNRYGHPHRSVVDRYQARGIQVRRTADCGAWLWQSDRTASGQCWREQQLRYWHARPQDVEPAPKPH